LSSPNPFVGITKALFGSFKTLLGCVTPCRVAPMPVLQPQSLGGQFQASEGWLTVPGWHLNPLLGSPEPLFGCMMLLKICLGLLYVGLRLANRELPTRPLTDSSKWQNVSPSKTYFIPFCVALKPCWTASGLC